MYPGTFNGMWSSFSVQMFHVCPSWPAFLAFTLKKKPLKPPLFTVARTVIVNLRLELLLLCCGASPRGVYVSSSQLLSFHLALCSSNLLLASNFISGYLSHPAER